MGNRFLSLHTVQSYCEQQYGRTGHAESDTVRAYCNDRGWGFHPRNALPIPEYGTGIVLGAFPHPHPKERHNAVKWNVKQRLTTAMETPTRIQRSVAMALVIAITALLISIMGMVRNAH